MRVTRLNLRNIRGIKNLELKFAQGEEPQASTLLIGRNGTGKSTILRSIALGLASVADATALLAERFGSPFVSAGQDKGTIIVVYVDNAGNIHSRAKSISRDGPNTERVEGINGDELHPRVPLVVALGAGRSNEGASAISTYSIVDSTYMLFDYGGTFIEPELTLRRLRDYVGDVGYERVLRRIKAALRLRQGDALDLPMGGGVVVSGPYRESPIPLRSWADGYRITLNWLLDVYAWAMMRDGAIDKRGHVHGVLLVDEIEQHLHPLMQRTIIQSIKKLFPKMQIVASTHSPLVVQGAEFYDIVALYRSGSTITARVLRDYSLFSIEDLFTAAELFQTPPYSTEVEKLRARYRTLAAKADLSNSERDQLKDLGRKLRHLRLLPPHSEDRTFDQLLKAVSELSDDPR